MPQKRQARPSQDTPLFPKELEASLEREWLGPDAADRLMRELLRLPLASEEIRMFGKWITVPRKVLWIGDPKISYTYAQKTHEPSPWPDVLKPLRERLQQETGQDFNGVLLNYYETGSDYMGWHADDERELGEHPLICSLSLGASRRFLFRQRSTREKAECFLTHGSLLKMWGESQKLWQHSLPKMKKVDTPRLNLTFRKITLESFSRQASQRPRKP